MDPASVLLQYCVPSVHAPVYYCRIILSVVSEDISAWGIEKEYLLWKKAYFSLTIFIYFQNNRPCIHHLAFINIKDSLIMYLEHWYFFFCILYLLVIKAQLSSPLSPSFSHPALCTSLTLWLGKCEVFQCWHYWQPSSYSFWTVRLW